jgi:type IV pilus assembly protein PilW
MKSNQQHALLRQTGFSLIEILVGLLIGLLATLVIMQVFTVFEGQKRTTTGSADAQTNGSIALYSIANELKMAGYGLLPSDNSPLECTTLNYDTTGITDISPVTITDGGTAAGASDSITIRYGTSDAGGVPTMIGGVTGNDAALSDSQGHPLNNMGCNVGDVALIINALGTACNFTTVTALSAAGATPVTVTLQNPAGAATSGNLSCLGTWKTTRFQVNPSYNPAVPANAQAYLQRTDSSFPVPGAGTAAPTVADIVNIQAQYGISATASWTQANLATNIANRNRIKAVRIAVVARNERQEKDLVTPLLPNGKACSSLTSTNPVGLCAWDPSSASPTTPSPAPAIDLTNDPNWQHYRYRVFETIIPLRNMIWSKSTL